MSTGKGTTMDADAEPVQQVVQRQLDVCNVRSLERRFVDCCAEDGECFSPPQAEPALRGRVWFFNQD